MGGPRRTNPADLEAGRRKIAQQKYDIETYGHSDPNIIERLGHKIKEKVEARRERKYPAPRRAGAAQKGFKPSSTEV